MTARRRTLTCRDAVRFLDDYHAEALDAAVRAAFDAHLAVCPDCAAFVRQYAATVGLAKEAFAAADDPRLPEALVEAILAARDGRRRPS